MIKGITIAFFLVLTTFSYADEMVLNKLNSCDDIDSIVRMLKSGVDGYVTGCRRGQNSIERQILQINSDYDERCALVNAPTPMLQGFTCFIFAIRDQSSTLSCYRKIPHEAFETYKRNYRSGESISAKEYIKSSSNCTSSTSDVSELPKTMMDAPLMSISEFEFGFGSHLKLDFPSEGIVSHGFAYLKPSNDESTSGIEYISGFINTKPKAKEEKFEILTGSQWRINVDRMESILDAFNKQIGIKNVITSGIAFEVLPVDKVKTGSRDKVSMLRSWEDDIASVMERFGFIVLPEEELEDRGPSLSNLRKGILSTIVYGQRKYMEKHLDERIIALANDDHKCAKRDQGALAAFITGWLPAEGISNDYGKISLFFVGAGNCGTSRGRKIIVDAVEQIPSIFFNKINGKQGY